MEWRWAAMGAQNAYKKAFAGSTGTNAIGDYAVFGYGGTDTGRTTVDKSAPVGSKSANELGLYDMTGNVHEWCWDWYNNGGTEYTLESDTDAGRGASSGINRVILGGSWKWDMSGCVLDYVNFDEPDARYIQNGFRIVRN
jgi:formylglycine-generating enzyme required for sulfatase activity